MNEKIKKEQLDEILLNQNYILDAVQNLNVRLEALEEKIDDDKMKDLKDILEGQSMLDEIVVKNSDDIVLLVKLKEVNDVKIKVFQQKIDLLDKEILNRDEELKKLIQHKIKTNEEHGQNESIICRYHNKGYCRRKSWCTFKHSPNICEIFLKDGNCPDKDCASRHPNNCKYKEDGCYRGDSCAYNHSESDSNLFKNNNDKNEEPRSNDNESLIMEPDDEISIETNKRGQECAKCGKSDDVKNKCYKCEEYFCSECEFKFNGESVMEFYETYNVVNYTCLTAHY